MSTANKLADLVQRRDSLRDNIHRVRGRLESAQTELRDVEEECRAKKIDPEKIDAVISQLDERLATEVRKLTDQIEAAEAQIQPFLSGGEQ